MKIAILNDATNIKDIVHELSAQAHTSLYIMKSILKFYFHNKYEK